MDRNSIDGAVAVRLAFILLAWALGLASGAVFLVRVGQGLGCHPDPECTWEDRRWWHLYLILWIALSPGIAATSAWWMARRRELADRGHGRAPGRGRSDDRGKR